MSQQISAEESILAAEAILKPLLDALEEEGATIRKTCQVVAKQLKSRNGRTALQAVNMVWSVRGFLIDRHEISGKGGVPLNIVIHSPESGNGNGKEVHIAKPE